MNRTTARLFALIVTCACASAACGGKVVVDGSAETAASGGATAGTGASSGDSTSTGGCDPASHTIDIASFNVSCMVASDCVAVFAGDLCGDCKCAFSAINVADKMKYDAGEQIKSVGTPPGGCFCPAMKPVCEQGHCGTTTP
jgi:hypothetical protein